MIMEVGVAPEKRMIKTESVKNPEMTEETQVVHGGSLVEISCPR